MNNNIIPIDRYLEFVENTNACDQNDLIQDMVKSGINPSTPFVLAIVQYCINVYDDLVEEFAQENAVDKEDVAEIAALRNAFHEAVKPLNEVDMSVFNIDKNIELSRVCDYINDNNLDE